jgi:hypothetical protein
MFAWRQSDSIPILVSRSVPEAEGLPEFDEYERWHEPAKSLYAQLKNGVLPALESGGDYVPGVRPDTGVINGMTVFGAEFLITRENRPAITRYVPKETLKAFEVPQDVSPLGVMPKVVEHLEHHRAALRERGLGDVVHVSHCDQQGPFDIAAQARGHDLFIDLYDDPEFVHMLMRKCTEVYVAISRLCRRYGPAPGAGTCAGGYWMENGSVRMCGDSDILISAAQHREFVAPYQQDAFRAMGGGWLHYCGGMPGFRRREGLHLHEVYAGIDGLRGLNWTTAADWLGEMRRLKALGLVHVGYLAREAGEPLEDYFRRALSPYDSRTGLVFEGPSVRPEEAGRAVETWRRVQDAVFH